MKTRSIMPFIYYKLHPIWSQGRIAVEHQQEGRFYGRSIYFCFGYIGWNSAEWIAQLTNIVTCGTANVLHFVLDNLHSKLTFLQLQYLRLRRCSVSLIQGQVKVTTVNSLPLASTEGCTHSIWTVPCK